MVGPVVLSVGEFSMINELGSCFYLCDAMLML